MEIVIKPNNKIMTTEIQNAIDTCFLSNGGKIILEKGEYQIGSIRLRSNCTLYLKSGAIIRGSRNIDDYLDISNDSVEPIIKDYKTDVVWEPASNRKSNEHITKPLSRWNNALIKIIDATNVSIIGEENSVIDGCNPYDELGEDYYRGPHGIAYYYSSNLYFSGYIIKNTGNWAHLGYKSKNITHINVEVHGGHDGVHHSSCDNFKIDSCRFYTGDDCIAGFDNNDVLVTNTILNSACSGLRFGGNGVLVENCKFFAPAKYYFRGSLAWEDKILGNPCPTSGRNNMLALFTYYCDYTLNVRKTPGNILIKNCTAQNCDRFLHFDFTGELTWQKNKPLTSITFDGVKATGVCMPFNAYGDSENPLTLNLKNVEIAFNEQTDSVIRSGNFKRINVENSNFYNVKGALVKCYGELGEIKTKNISGIDTIYFKTDEQFKSDNI